MRVVRRGSRLGSGPKHQARMLSNLALSLFEHERIKTTEAKAKALKPFAERLITKAKKGTVHDRRQVLATIEDRDVVHKLFADIGPRFADRNGGYTRILKLGPRNGDGAPMALVELVEEGTVVTVEETGEGASRRRRLRTPVRRRGAAAVPEAEAETEEPEEEGSEDIDEDAAEAVMEAEEASIEASQAEPDSPETVEHQKETGDEGTAPDAEGVGPTAPGGAVAAPDDQEKPGS